MNKTVLVTQIRSAIGQTARQRSTLKGLGLRKIGSQAQHVKKPEILGMIQLVHHLVQVEEIEKEILS